MFKDYTSFLVLAKYSFSFSFFFSSSFDLEKDNTVEAYYYPWFSFGERGGEGEIKSRMEQQLRFVLAFQGSLR